jgi:hypothetical protein
MRKLAELLLGQALDPDLFEAEDGYHARIRESGEWCQSTPGHEPVRRLGAVMAGKGARERRHGPFGITNL